MQQTNDFIWLTSCQGKLYKLYARKDQLVLGSERATTSNYLFNTNIVHPYLDFVAIKYVNDIPKTSATETTQNRLYKNILYVRLNLIMIISLNKLNI